MRGTPRFIIFLSSTPLLPHHPRNPTSRSAILCGKLGYLFGSTLLRIGIVLGDGLPPLSETDPIKRKWLRWGSGNRTKFSAMTFRESRLTWTNYFWQRGITLSGTEPIVPAKWTKKGTRMFHRSDMAIHAFIRMLTAKNSFCVTIGCVYGGEFLSKLGFLRSQLGRFSSPPGMRREHWVPCCAGP